jgi:hypothetical protein
MQIEGLVRSQLDAIEHSVGRYTVGFIFPWSGQRHVPTASGVAVKWANKRVVVSAKHVFEGDPKDVQLALPVKRPFSRDEEIKAPSSFDAEIVRRPMTPIIESDSYDLAFFEVNENFGQSSDLDFYPLPTFARTPEHPAQCALVGYPEDLTVPLPYAGEAIINVAARWSETLDPNEEARFLSTRDFDVECHFLMKFRAANKGKTAPGFSGCGVWFSIRQPASAQVWRPNPGLAGIQSSWFAKRSITLAVKVELLVEFLSNILGVSGTEV